MRSSRFKSSHIGINQQKQTLHTQFQYTHKLNKPQFNQARRLCSHATIKLLNLHPRTDKEQKQDN